MGEDLEEDVGRLTADACDVQLHGDAATASCRKWNFTLREAGTDWKIDSARAER